MEQVELRETAFLGAGIPKGRVGTKPRKILLGEFENRIGRNRDWLRHPMRLFRQLEHEIRRSEAGANRIRKLVGLFRTGLRCHN